tara:strand:+ start:1888 stop:2196 length:309 start_codon:yes stop_codon:yes gene_type:complete
MKNIEIYFFWLDFYGETCNISDAIIKHTIAEKLPDVKYQVIDLNEQPSSNFIPKTNYREKVVVMYNNETDEFVESNIRELIYHQTPVEEIMQSIINEVNEVL